MKAIQLDEGVRPGVRDPRLLNCSITQWGKRLRCTRKIMCRIGFVLLNLDECVGRRSASNRSTTEMDLSRRRAQVITTYKS